MTQINNQDFEADDEELFAAEVERRRTGAPLDDATPPPPPAAEPPPASSASPAAAAPAPSQPVAGEKPEWYASLSDDAKGAYDKQQADLIDIRQKYTALHGRLAPVQQANERLRQQLEQAGQPPQAQANSSATGRQQPGQPPAAPPTPTLDLASVPEFVEFREAFPEEAKAIAALFGRQAATVDNLQQQLGQVSQGLEHIQLASVSRQRDAELHRLAEAHPDWMQVRPSEDFARWLSSQPRSVAQLADSSGADDCIWILDQYKRDVWAERQLNVAATPPAQNPAPSQAQTVRTRRQQIRSVPGVDPQGGTVGNPAGAPQDFLSDEDIWEEEVRRRLKTQRDARRD